MTPDFDALRARAREGEELLRAAARLNDIPSLRALAAQVTPEEWRNGWQRDLISVAQTPEAIETLIDCGAIVDAVDEYGFDALDRALETFDRDFEEEETRYCDLLLASGVPVERNGGDRLRAASERLNPRAAAWLLRRSGPVSQGLLDECLNIVVGELFCAGQSRTAEIRELIGLLIASGANPNAPDELGCLPLFHAGNGSAWLDDHSTEVMKDLLRLGADPMARGREDWTALDMLLYDAAPGWGDLMFDVAGIPERIARAERFLEECPASKFAPALRFLIDAMRSRMRP